jgi:hypothetical protein
LISIAWVDDIEGVEIPGKRLLQRRKDEKLPVFTPPEVCIGIDLFYLHPQNLGNK